MEMLTSFWGIVECGFCLGALVALALIVAGVVVALRRKERAGWVLLAAGGILLCGILTTIGAFVLLVIERAPR